MSNFDPKDFQVAEEVIKMADVIEENTTVDDDVLIVDDKTFEKTLPEGLDMKTVKSYQKHVGNFVAASRLAIGRQAYATLAEKEGFEKMRSTIKCGGDQLDLEVVRERQGINPQSKEPIVSYGLVTPAWRVRGSRKIGQSLKVNDYLKSMAGELLGS